MRTDPNPPPLDVDGKPCRQLLRRKQLLPRNVVFAPHRAAEVEPELPRLLPRPFADPRHASDVRLSIFQYVALRDESVAPERPALLLLHPFQLPTHLIFEPFP